LEHRGLEDYFNIQMITIGKNIDISTSFTYLCDLFNIYIEETTINEYSKISFSAYTYKYDIDGLSFKQIKGWKLTNEGF
jgi:hypothetical protein